MSYRVKNTAKENRCRTLEQNSSRSIYKKAGHPKKRAAEYIEISLKSKAGQQGKNPSRSIYKNAGHPGKAQAAQYIKMQDTRAKPEPLNI